MAARISKPALEGEEKERFLAACAARLRELYPRREGGETLYIFPRPFIAARLQSGITEVILQP